MVKTGDERTKQVAVGAGILLALALAVCSLLAGWRHLPGLLGEWVGFMVGVATTPFILEASFAILGLTVVLAINQWRRNRAGEEMVYLEQTDSPDKLPDHAKWAIYREPPLDGEIPTLRTQAEGALAIGDYESAAECFAAMSEAEMKLPESLELRLKLAQATGKTDLARHLESQLRLTNSGAK
jgi:hypothetical protein